MADKAGDRQFETSAQWPAWLPQAIDTGDPATFGNADQQTTRCDREQDSAEGVRHREQWRAETMKIDPNRLVSLDECGVTIDMRRLYGRARRGQRIHEGAPDGRWRTVTLLGTVSLNGSQAVMTVEAATDGEVFLAYLRRGLTSLPASLLYSPDFIPIEPCWSVIKQRLRKLKARSLAALDEAIPLALISPAIALNCFTHCDYTLG